MIYLIKKQSLFKRATVVRVKNRRELKRKKLKRLPVKFHGRSSVYDVFYVDGKVVVSLIAKNQFVYIYDPCFLLIVRDGVQ